MATEREFYELWKVSKRLTGIEEGGQKRNPWKRRRERKNKVLDAKFSPTPND